MEPHEKLQVSIIENLLYASSEHPANSLSLQTAMLAPARLRVCTRLHSTALLLAMLEHNSAQPDIQAPTTTGLWKRRMV